MKPVTTQVEQTAAGKPAAPTPILISHAELRIRIGCRPAMRYEIQAPGQHHNQQPQLHALIQPHQHQIPQHGRPYPMRASSTSISMTATTATDPSGGVQYYFDETTGNPGGTDSGWQTSSSYTDTGLTCGTHLYLSGANSRCPLKYRLMVNITISNHNCMC